MKYLRSTLSLLAALVCGSAFAVSAPLIIPRTSTESLRTHPLSEGQAAYHENDQETAALWLGQSGGKHRLVADPFAIRGYLTRDIGADEYNVTHTSGITYDATNYKWKYNNTNTGIVEQVIFTVADGRTVTDVEYDTINQSSAAAMEVALGKITPVINGHTVTFNFIKERTGGGELSLMDVYLAYNPDGGKSEVTDLSDLHILVKDSKGEDDLSLWREGLIKNMDARHYADEWYKYDGSNAVTMTYVDYSEKDKTSTDKSEVISRNRANNYGNGFWFDGPGSQRHMYKIYLDTATTNMCMKAGNLIPMEVSFRGSDTNNFKISSFAYDSTAQRTTLFLDSVIESFSTANLEIYWTDVVTNKFDTWTKFNSSEWTYSEGNIVIPNRTNSNEFYRIVYSASSITPPHSIIYLRGDVIAEDGFTVKDFNHVWQQTDGKALGIYIEDEVTSGISSSLPSYVDPKIEAAKRADLVALSATTVVATNGVIYNASIGAGPLSVTVPDQILGKSDSFTIRITCTSDTQLGTVQGPSGQTVTLEWLSTDLTAAGSIHSTKAMYLKMTRVDTWTFVCEGKEVQ